MTPQLNICSLDDAALINVAPSKSKESPKKVRVKVTRKKQTSEDGKGSTSFQHENKQIDITFNRGGFIKPLTLVGESKNKQDGGMKRTRL